MPRRHRRALLAGRLLRHGLRGGAPGRRLHDAGVPAVRRLPGQRRRAVADPQPGRAAEDRRSSHPTRPQRQRQRRRRTSCPTSATSGWCGQWAIPGTPGLEHRIGGLEKEDVTGNVSYDPANHEHMVQHAGPEDRQHRQRHPAAGGRRPGRGRPAGDRLGRHLWLDHDGRAAGPAQGPARWPRPTCAISTRCRATPATC